MEESVVKERECGSKSFLPADGDSSSLPLKVSVEHKMVTLVHTVQPVYCQSDMYYYTCSSYTHIQWKLQ